MDATYANSSSDSRHHAAARGQVATSSAISAGRGLDAPLSPVQAQLQRQRELLSELEAGANALIDPLRTALTHDPRESKGINGSTEPAQPPSCDLELVLLQANAALESSIQRLREIRNAIRL